jgi:hypothetical protein
MVYEVFKALGRRGSVTGCCTGPQSALRCGSDAGGPQMTRSAPSDLGAR